MNYNLTADFGVVRGCMLNSRILWFFTPALRPRDRKTRERPPSLRPLHPRQRGAAPGFCGRQVRLLHPATGSGGGNGFGLCEDIRPDRDWIHIAHGVRNTAAGTRYIIYAFASALEGPARGIAEPVGT